jgi:hypothetical protein
MAEITFEMAEQTYNTAKEIFDKNIEKMKNQKINKLCDETRMNEKSATMIINCLLKFFRGVKFKMTGMGSKEHVEYYLSQIKKDFDDDIYENALFIWEDFLHGNKDKADLPSEHEQQTKNNISITNNHLVSIPPVPNNDFLSNYYNWIYEKTRNYYIQINEYRKENKKQEIFKEIDAVKLWSGIEKLLKYSEAFDIFIKSLHGLFLENARDETNGNYRSRFPDSFVKSGTWTKDFIDDVKIIRNKYAHPKSKDKIEANEWGNKRTFLDVCEKYSGSRRLPESIEDSQELQIGVMNQFKNVLRNLLGIVRNE